VKPARLPGGFVSAERRMLRASSAVHPEGRSVRVFPKRTAKQER